MKSIYQVGGKCARYNSSFTEKMLCSNKMNFEKIEVEALLLKI